jgi:hypothetical protein
VMLLRKGLQDMRDLERQRRGMMWLSGLSVPHCG